MFEGKIPFPGDFVFDFPPYAPLKPAYSLLPQTNIGDLVSSFYPYRTIAARAVRSGSMPLWNPYMLSGTPFLAMAQSALFYPPNFLYYVLPVPVAWSIGFILRRVLATLFTALFIRRIGGTSTGAIAAGLMFSFCGFLTAWQGQTMSDAAIWLPLICYSVIRLREETDARSIAIAAFAFAMPVLAGHPETAAHLALTGSALALFLALSPPRLAFLKAFTVSGLIAFGLAAVQILPTLEWLKYVNHSLKDPWPLPPLHSILALVSRDIIRTKNVIGLLLPEQSGYLAMMTFAAAPIALMRRQSRRYAIFFALAAIVAFSAAYGIGPVHWLVSITPGLQMMKNSRLTLVVSFSMAVLAGLGISALGEFGFSDSKQRRFRAVLLAFAGSSIALVLIYLVHLLPVSELIESVRVPRFGFVLLIASALTLALKAASYLPQRVFSVLTILLIAIDLGTVTYGAIPFTKVRDVFPSIPLFDRLPADTTARFRIAQFGAAYGANFETMYGRFELGGYELPLERLKRFTADLGRNDMDSVMLIPRAVLDTKDRRLDMLNAKYYIVSEWDPLYMEFRNHPDRFRFLYTFGDTDVIENLRSLGPAFLVPLSGVEAIPDESKQLIRVKDPAFDPEHQVVVSEGPSSTAEPRGNEKRIEWRSTENDSFELDVTTSDPSVLVISQIDYPGWNADVDGKPAPIVRANYAFPAIFVSAGSHHVRFSFEPDTFKVGLALSVVAVIVLAVLATRGIRRSNPNRI